MKAGHAVAIPVGRRTAMVLAFASLAGLAVILWPLFATPGHGEVSDVIEAPLLFIAILPVVVFTVLAQMSEGGMDSKALAMLGVLAAVNAALRPLGAGLGGVETVFFLLILAGRVYGAGFGFALGSISLFASALLTAGVGPWLPFQMLTSAWIGLGAGLLPKRVTGRAEIIMLAAYGAISAYAFGALMNMWFWPMMAGSSGADSSVAFIPGDSVLANLKRFTVFTLATSTGGWDTGRAITNVVAILVLGPAILAVLRRAVRKASFGAPVDFSPGEGLRSASGGVKNYSLASLESSSGSASASSSEPSSDPPSSSAGSSGSSSGTVTGTQSGSGSSGSSGTSSITSVGRNSS